MPRPQHEQDWITNNVVEWDEFGQGYNADGKLLVCICGALALDTNWAEHYCPCDAPEGWNGAP